MCVPLPKLPDDCVLCMDEIILKIQNNGQFKPDYQQDQCGIIIDLSPIHLRLVLGKSNLKVEAYKSQY